MRPVLFQDVAAAARVLLCKSPEERQALCSRMVREADAADRHTRRLGRIHPVWGNGTLLAAARQWPLAAERPFNDPCYRACFAMVLEELDRWCDTSTCKAG